MTHGIKKRKNLLRINKTGLASVLFLNVLNSLLPYSAFKLYLNCDFRKEFSIVPRNVFLEFSMNDIFY